MTAKLRLSERARAHHHSHTHTQAHNHTASSRWRANATKQTNKHFYLRGGLPSTNSQKYKADIIHIVNYKMQRIYFERFEMACIRCRYYQNRYFFHVAHITFKIIIGLLQEKKPKPKQKRERFIT